MDIMDFLLGFGNKKIVSEAVKAGDRCRNKDTGVYSVCRKVMDDMYYGKRSDSDLWEIGLVDKFEKV